MFAIQFAVLLPRRTAVFTDPEAAHAVLVLSYLTGFPAIAGVWP